MEKPSYAQSAEAMSLMYQDHCQRKAALRWRERFALRLLQATYPNLSILPGARELTSNDLHQYLANNCISYKWRVQLHNLLVGLLSHRYPALSFWTQTKKILIY